jgi:polyribonucleotide nucleotidyltransferase
MVGIVSIASPDRAKVAEAKRQIMLIVDPPTAEVGAVYDGRVVNITKFGAFISILPGRDGLVHISKLGGGKRIDRVEDVLELGQEIQVIVEDVDPNGKISLKPAGDAPSKPAPAAPTASVVDSEDDAPVADSDDADLDESGSDDAGSDDADLDESGSDDAESDDADYDDADYDDDAPVAASDGPIQSNFEDAFKAELEAVHGDLGNAVSANRGGGGGGGGGRRRRGR